MKVQTQSVAIYRVITQIYLYKNNHHSIICQMIQIEALLDLLLRLSYWKISQSSGSGEINFQKSNRNNNKMSDRSLGP